MKTKITITFIATSLLLLGNISNILAQNWLTAGNGLTGGTSSTPNEWMGSNNLYDLILKTNNTQRMRVLSGGHVLIGSGTTATYPITLNDYTNAGTLNTGGNFAVSFHSIVGGAAIGSQDINNNAVFGVTGSTSDMLFATYNGSSFDERVRIMSGGNVGIGTPAPDIFGNGSAYRTLSVLGPNTSAYSCGILELATQSTDADANVAGVLNFIASSNASTKQSIAQIVSFTQGTTATNRGGFLIFNTKPDGASATLERMRIDNTGNVGIGTSTPGGTLQLLNTTHTNPNTVYSSLYAGTANILFRANAADVHFFANSYYNSSNAHIYASNGGASYMGLNYPTAGTIGFFTAPSGTAGNPVTYTNRMTILQTGNVGIGTTTPGYILTVNGQPGCNGFTQFFNYSDSTLKTNISNIDSSLAKIMKLRPVEFNYNQDYLNIWNDTIMPNNAAELQKIHRGFIAQEVKQIFPEMVGIDSVKGQAYCDLNLSNLQVYLVKAMQEQQTIIDSLKQNQKTTDSLFNHQKTIDSLLTATLNNMMIHQQTTDSLMAIIANCCELSSNSKMMLNNSGQKQGDTLQVELADNNQIMLFQNQPNPFNENTVIRYFVPENIKGTASVIFYDVYGQEIKRAEITTKGFGNINVNTENLSSGIYSYSLIVEGKIIDTKKMIKSK